MGQSIVNCCAGRREPKTQEKAAFAPVPPEQPHFAAPEPEPESLDDQALLPRCPTIEEPAAEPSREATAVALETAMHEAMPEVASQVLPEEAVQPPEEAEKEVEVTNLTTQPPAEAVEKKDAVEADEATAQVRETTGSILPTSVLQPDSTETSPDTPRLAHEVEVLPEEAVQPPEEAEKDVQVTDLTTEPLAEEVEKKAAVEADEVTEQVQEATGSILPTSVLQPDSKETSPDTPRLGHEVEAVEKNDAPAEAVEGPSVEQETPDSMLPISALQPVDAQAVDDQQPPIPELETEASKESILPLSALQPEQTPVQKPQVETSAKADEADPVLEQESA